MRNATIDDYRWLYAHGYMPDGLACARAIMADIVERCPGTFLDYGGGRGDLAHWISTKTAGRCAYWDPATCAAQTAPSARAEWLVSCDVLEHIPEAELDATLSDFKRMSWRGLLLTIANMSDVQHVNGEQVELHLIQQPAEWWIAKIGEHWPTCHVEHRRICKDRFALIVDFA